MGRDSGALVRARYRLRQSGNGATGVGTNVTLSAGKLFRSAELRRLSVSAAAGASNLLTARPFLSPPRVATYSWNVAGAMNNVGSATGPTWSLRQKLPLGILAGSKRKK